MAVRPTFEALSPSPRSHRAMCLWSTPSTCDNRNAARRPACLCRSVSPTPVSLARRMSSLACYSPCVSQPHPNETQPLPSYQAWQDGPKPQVVNKLAIHLWNFSSPCQVASPAASSILPQRTAACARVPNTHRLRPRPPMSAMWMLCTHHPPRPTSTRHSVPASLYSGCSPRFILLFVPHPISPHAVPRHCCACKASKAPEPFKHVPPAQVAPACEVLPSSAPHTCVGSASSRVHC